MDRGEQEYLRDAHAGNMVVEQGEPRTLLIQDIVSTLLARFQHDKPAALESLDRSVVNKLSTMRPVISGIAVSNAVERIIKNETKINFPK